MAAAWQSIFVTRVKQHNQSGRSSVSSVGKRNKYRQVVVVVLLSDSRPGSLSKSPKTPPTGICDGLLLHKLLITKRDVLHISNSVLWTNNNRGKKATVIRLWQKLTTCLSLFGFLTISWFIFHSAAAYGAFDHAPGSSSAVGCVFELRCLKLCVAVYEAKTLSLYRKKCLKWKEVSV